LREDDSDYECERVVSEEAVCGFVACEGIAHLRGTSLGQLAPEIG
jgi:hypothetical protein